MSDACLPHKGREFATDIALLNLVSYQFTFAKLASSVVSPEAKWLISRNKSNFTNGHHIQHPYFITQVKNGFHLFVTVGAYYNCA